VNAIERAATDLAEVSVRRGDGRSGGLQEDVLTPPLDASTALAASASSSLPRRRAGRRSARPEQRTATGWRREAAQSGTVRFHGLGHRAGALGRRGEDGHGQAAPGRRAGRASDTGERTRLLTRATPSTWNSSPARSIRIAAQEAISASIAASVRPAASNARNRPGLRTNVFSCRKKTVSSPTVSARSPARW